MFIYYISTYVTMVLKVEFEREFERKFRETYSELYQDENSIRKAISDYRNIERNGFMFFPKLRKTNGKELGGLDSLKWWLEERSEVA